MSNQPHYHGHRERLKERFRKTNGEGLADYELLELLLMQAIPRKDVKPLAKALITKYGSLADVLNASIQDLAKEKGLGEGSATSLKLAHAVAISVRKDGLKKKPSIENRLELLDYLYTKMSSLKHEEFHVIYLDGKNNILDDEVLFKGTVNSSAVYPREVTKAALKHGALNIVLVHNHPSGDPSPSTEDENITEDIMRAVGAVEIEVYDHIIIGNNKHYSFRDFGKI
jgi:DNA repair protein RadC